MKNNNRRENFMGCLTERTFSEITRVATENLTLSGKKGISSDGIQRYAVQVLWKADKDANKWHI